MVLMLYKHVVSETQDLLWVRVIIDPSGFLTEFAVLVLTLYKHVVLGKVYRNYT